MIKKKINSGYITETKNLDSRILRYFPEDYRYFFSAPLFGATDYSNKSTYIQNTVTEKELDNFFAAQENSLATLIGYHGMGKSTILKNYLGVHKNNEVTIVNNQIICSKFNWQYKNLKENIYKLKHIIRNINSELCNHYNIKWFEEKENFYRFLAQTDSDSLFADQTIDQALSNLASHNSELFETRYLQFILLKLNIKQFVLVIDNIENLGSKSSLKFLKKIIECYHLLTENTFKKTIIKLLISLCPETLYTAQQNGCFDHKEINYYIKLSSTINLEKYFNLKLKLYNKENGHYDAWLKCFPLFMKVSQKYNRKYDQIIKKLCNYNVSDSMQMYSKILSNSRWMHNLQSSCCENESNYFNKDDIIVNNITVIRAISCMDDEMFLPKQLTHIYTSDTGLHSFRNEDSKFSSPICNLLYSTRTEDFSIVILYIIKFFYKYCGSNNLYGHIYQKAGDIIRIFSEIFYGIDNIDKMAASSISYLFDMHILDKSIKTKKNEKAQLTSQSRLYLTPRGEITWQMLAWDSELLEVFREDYYRDYSTFRNPFCSYILMQQNKQLDIFSDLISMISDLLELENRYREAAKKNDTITSLKRNFGEECVCAQLFEGLKQSMSYSGLIKNSEIQKIAIPLQKAIDSAKV